MLSRKFIRKIISILTVMTFGNTNTFAMEKQYEAHVELASLISIVNAGAAGDEILETARNSALAAHKQGISEKQFLNSISEELALELTDEEITASINDMRDDHSPERLALLAMDLENTNANSGQRVLGVLLTFLISTLLLVGVFFLLADIFDQEPEREPW